MIGNRDVGVGLVLSTMRISCIKLGHDSSSESGVGHVVRSLDADLLVANTLYGHMIEIDFAIDDQQRVRLGQDILVDADAIQELFQDGAKLHVLFIQSLPLLLDGEVIKLHLVEAFEKVVKVCPLIDANVRKLLADLLLEVIVTAEIKIALLEFRKHVTRKVEWQDFLSLSFKFSAQLGGLHDLLSEC